MTGGAGFRQRHFRPKKEREKDNAETRRTRRWRREEAEGFIYSQVQSCFQY
jgi:hypothetical protein